MDLVREIDFKKRDWRRDISILLVGLGLIVLGTTAWYEELLSVTPPILIGALVLAVVPHELLHGLLYRIWGGKVKFGAMMTTFGPVFYAASPGFLFLRNKMVVVALMPQVLTILCIGMAYAFPNGAWRTLLVLAAVLNVGGGAGDYYLVRCVLHYPKTLQVEDSATGLKLFMPSKGETDAIV